MTAQKQRAAQQRGSEHQTGATTSTPIVAPPLGFTLLETRSPSLWLTKTFRRDPVTGEVASPDAAVVAHFKGREARAGSIEELYQILSRLSGQHRVCVIRGAIRPGVDTRKMRRLSLPRYDPETGAIAQEPTIDDVDRAWVCWELDGALPEGADKSFIPNDPDRAREIVMSVLPDACRRASYVLQWSSSAGMKIKLAAHVWQLLNRPVSTRGLRAWAKKSGIPGLDPAVFQAVQEHYTAAPRFLDGIEDPLPGRRVSLHRGEVDLVDVDELGIPDDDEIEAAEAARVKAQAGSLGLFSSNGFFSYLAQIGNPSFHEPIKSAVGSYVRDHGPQGTDVGALVQVIKTRVFDADPGGRSREEIERYASDNFLRPLIRNILSAHTAPQPSGSGPYRIEHGRIVWAKEDREGALALVPLGNFWARIGKEVIKDDGNGQARFFELSGGLDTGRPLPPVQVPAASYGGMAWPTAMWGSRAVVFAGNSTKDRMRDAIQRLSPDPIEEYRFAHTGWRQIRDQWRFLHAAGALGPDGNDPSVIVELTGSLAQYRLPDPPKDRAEATRRTVCSLLTGGLAPDRVAFPLFSAMHRAVFHAMVPVSMVVYVYGPTGTFKTSLLVVFQRMFGAGFTERNLASWESSANYLEITASRAQSVPFTVDDWVSDQTKGRRDEMQAKAMRFLRECAGASGRGTATSDRGTRNAPEPKCLAISTAEDLVRGHSIVARCSVVELSRGDVDKDKLTTAQVESASGVYTEHMAGFISWVSSRFDELERTGPTRIAALRDAAGSGAHARTSPAQASLLWGFEVFAQYAREIGALSPAEVEELLVRARSASADVNARQRVHVEANDPVRRFLEVVPALLSSGRAHIAALDNSAPPSAVDWGWRMYERENSGRETSVSQELRPEGRRIGWTDGTLVWLDPESVYAEAQTFATAQGGGFGTSQPTLWRALQERGVLNRVEADGSRPTVRKRIGGCSTRVLEIQRGLLGNLDNLDTPWTHERKPAPGADSSTSTSSKISGHIMDTSWTHHQCQRCGEPADGRLCSGCLEVE